MWPGLNKLAGYLPGAFVGTLVGVAIAWFLWDTQKAPECVNTFGRTVDCVHFIGTHTSATSLAAPIVVISIIAFSIGGYYFKQRQDAQRTG